MKIAEICIEEHKKTKKLGYVLICRSKQVYWCKQLGIDKFIQNLIFINLCSILLLVN